MPGRADQLRVRLARALQNHSSQGAHNALDEAFASLTTDAALSEVVMPCLQATGAPSMWTASAIADVEFSSSLLESRLLTMADGWDSGGSPTAVIAHTEHERHTLGGIIFGLALRDRGWRIVYLGPAAPASSAVDAAEATAALALVLAARDAAALVALHASLRRLHPSRHLVLAGEGATARSARQLGAELLPRHPVLAARELDRRLGPDAHRGAPFLGRRLGGHAHSGL